VWLNKLVYTEEIFINLLQEIYNENVILNSLAIAKKNEWLNITINIIVVIVHIVTSSILIFTVSFFYDKKIKIRNCIIISMKCEIIFLLQILFKCIYIQYIAPPTSISELVIIPFSLLQIFDYDKLENWVSFILNYFNLFEVLYLLFMSMFFSVSAKIKILKSIELMGIGYLFMLFIYFSLVTLLYLN
jgi:hypothetical protein